VALVVPGSRRDLKCGPVGADTRRIHSMRVRALLFGLALCIAGSACAGEKCTADVQTCLDYLAKKIQTKGWLGIHYEHDAEKGGYTITKIVPGSPADRAGFMVGDFVVAMNGISLKEESEELKAVYAEMMPGKTFSYTVRRNGTEKVLKAELAKMPEDVALQMVGAHMLEHASIDEAPAEKK
jgi:predicted metalloprotease with PDZ domain